MVSNSHDSGLRGEALACEYLRENGYQVVATRYRAQGGEIDIIARDNTYLCFIEVKYRPDGRIASGLGAITKDKQARMRRAAQAYIAQQQRREKMRFDMIEVTRAGVWHVKNAGGGA